MNPEEATEYTQSLSQIHEGGWRQIAWAIKQGIPKVLGISNEDWVQTIGGTVRLRLEDRREAVVELSDQGLSQREIGAALGVDPATVNRDLKPVADATPEPEEPRPEPEPVADATPEPEPASAPLQPEPPKLQPVEDKPEPPDRTTETQQSSKVTDFVGADNDYEDRKFLAEFTKSLGRVGFMDFDPVEIAEVADSETIKLLTTTKRRVDDFVKAVKDARRGTISRIGGRQ